MVKEFLKFVTGAVLGIAMWVGVTCILGLWYKVLLNLNAQTVFEVFELGVRAEMHLILLGMIAIILFVAGNCLVAGLLSAMFEDKPKKLFGKGEYKEEGIQLEKIKI